MAPDRPRDLPPGQGEDFENTSVDLGEDLLRDEGSIPGLLKREPPKRSEITSPTGDLKDQLHTAEILMNEGLFEDSKRMLHGILYRDPDYMPARKMLNELHELELKQIFGDGGPRTPNLRERRQTEREKRADPGEVLEKLDRELGLNIEGSRDSTGLWKWAELELFPSKKSVDDFAAQLDRDLSQCSTQDRIDVGVGFLEMGFHELAVRQFSVAARDEKFRVQATGLLAQALLGANRPFEASLSLESLLEDIEVEPLEKLDLMYLAGRSAEQMNRYPEAATWYWKVSELDPRYRDIEERLKRIAPPNAGPGR